MENYFDHVIGGFIILHVVDDEADVQHLAVDLSFNGKGGGRALLGEALSRLTIRDVKAVFLEVRASNARALRLYERAGFRRVGVRVGYYVDTGDDAIVMQYSL
jgi:ribosomal-protein-alanine N-acetyltransferase